MQITLERYVVVGGANASRRYDVRELLREMSYLTRYLVDIVFDDRDLENGFVLVVNGVLKVLFAIYTHDSIYKIRLQIFISNYYFYNVSKHISTSFLAWYHDIRAWEK